MRRPALRDHSASNLKVLDKEKRYPLRHEVPHLQSKRC